MTEGFEPQTCRRRPRRRGGVFLSLHVVSNAFFHATQVDHSGKIYTLSSSTVKCPAR
jgi:hypothetical protein